MSDLQVWFFQNDWFLGGSAELAKAGSVFWSW